MEEKKNAATRLATLWMATTSTDVGTIANDAANIVASNYEEYMEVYDFLLGSLGAYKEVG